MTFTISYPTYSRLAPDFSRIVTIKAGDPVRLFEGTVRGYGYNALPHPYQDADGDWITGEMTMTIEVDDEELRSLTVSRGVV